jgi:hypothetical protein
MANIAPDYGTAEHTKLRELVRSRRGFSKRHISARYDRWNESERVYRLFVEPDQKAPDGTKKQPWDWSIVVPMTYSVMQTELAFDLTLFTQRRPVVQLEGQGPEDVRPAKLMEQVLHHEWVTRQMLLDVYTWLLDRRRFGVGILWNTYIEESTTRIVQKPRTMRFLGEEIPIGGTTRTEESVPGYEGNQPYAVDPYQFWPDPRMTMARAQEGEFMGRTVTRSYSYMKQQEAQKVYRNVDKIPRLRPKATQDGPINAQESVRDEIMGLSQEYDNKGDTIDFLDKGNVDLDEFVLTIIPKDYKLGTSSTPQKWWVTLANDETVVRASPYTPIHQKYPGSIFEGSLDAHSRFNPGDPEILQGLQDMISWLLVSRFQNIRTSLNNMWLVNSKWVELRDILEPQPGKLLRLTKEGESIAERLGLDKMLKQFPVADVTQSHLTDMAGLVDLFQRTAAAPENLQGITSARDRTLGEQQMAVSAATRRLQINAQLAWSQGVVPWNTQRVMNIQENMELARFLRVVGDWPKALGARPMQPFMKISPEEIQGQFIFEIIDGTINNQQMMLESLTNVWTEWARNPMLQQRFDGIEIFRRLALQWGVTDIDEFVLPVQPGMPGMPAGPSGVPVGPDGLPIGVGGNGRTAVRPDEAVLREEERGNLVAIGGANGAPRRT